MNIICQFFGVLLLMNFASANFQTGLRSIIFYTYDETFTGTDVSVQQLDGKTLEKLLASKNFLTKPKPLQSSYDFLKLLDGRCDIKLSCDKQCSVVPSLTSPGVVKKTSTAGNLASLIPTASPSAPYSVKVTAPKANNDEKTTTISPILNKTPETLNKTPSVHKRTLTVPKSIPSVTPKGSIKTSPIHNEITSVNTVHKRTPSVNTGNPSVNTVISSVNTGTPHVKTATPSVNTGSPSVNTVISSVNTGTQAVKTATPSVNTGNPSINTVISSVNTGSPSVNTEIPSSQTQRPALSNKKIDIEKPLEIVRESNIAPSHQHDVTASPSEKPRKPSAPTKFVGSTYLPQPTAPPTTHEPWTGTYKTFTGTFRQYQHINAPTGTWKPRRKRRPTTTTAAPLYGLIAPESPLEYKL